MTDITFVLGMLLVWAGIYLAMHIALRLSVPTNQPVAVIFVNLLAFFIGPLLLIIYTLVYWWLVVQ